MRTRSSHSESLCPILEKKQKTIDMRNLKTVIFQKNEYEYEIDDKNIIWVKVGDNFIGADKPCSTKPNDDEIKAIVIDILKSHFSY